MHARRRSIVPHEQLTLTVPPVPRLPRRLRAVALVLTLGVIVALWWWGYTAEGRALRALPEAQRQLLWRSTLETIREVCLPAPPRSLRALCRDHARLLLEFRECDVDCRAMGRRLLATPTR